MSSKTPPAPDMGGLQDDWQRAAAARRRAEEAENGDENGDEKPPPHPLPVKGRPGRTRGGKRPAPEAASAKATTVRLDPEEAAEIDRWILELRDDAARRQLDKAEVYRELIRLAREHPPTRKALLKRIKT